MNKRTARQQAYAAELARDRDYAEAKAAFRAVLRAMDAAIREGQDPDSWHELVSRARKAARVDPVTAISSASNICTWQPLDWRPKI